MPTGISIDVQVIDHGWEDIRKNIKLLGDHGGICNVGVQGEQAAANHQHSELTLAQLAGIHEFGTVIHQPARRVKRTVGKGKKKRSVEYARGARTIVIPARSSLRDTVDIYQEPIARREVLLSQGVLFGKFTLLGGLELFGMYVVGLIRQRMANGIPPPNRPSTIARKGSSKPLIDTGELRNAITWKAEVPK